MAHELEIQPQVIDRLSDLLPCSIRPIRRDILPPARRQREVVDVVVHIVEIPVVVLREFPCRAVRYAHLDVDILE